MIMGKRPRAADSYLQHLYSHLESGLVRNDPTSPGHTGGLDWLQHLTGYSAVRKPTITFHTLPAPLREPF